MPQRRLVTRSAGAMMLRAKETSSGWRLVVHYDERAKKHRARRRKPVRG